MRHFCNFCNLVKFLHFINMAILYIRFIYENIFYLTIVLRCFVSINLCRIICKLHSTLLPRIVLIDFPAKRPNKMLINLLKHIAYIIVYHFISSLYAKLSNFSKLSPISHSSTHLLSNVSVVSFVS